MTSHIDITRHFFTIFFQIVWRKSKKVGIAYATKMKKKSQTLCTVVVAKFDPIGNTGDLVQNVDKGSFEKSFCGKILIN